MEEGRGCGGEGNEMIQASIEEIRAKAHELHEADAQWHFHMLTPDCSLNHQGKYAFIVEQTDEPASYVYVSDQAEKDLDQELLPLLHGSEVLDESVTGSGYQASDVIKAMIKRAKELNDQDIEWHHHMLFPDCQFNTHPGKFVLMLEDPQTKEVLESVTEQEPIGDLQQIEPLFAGKAHND